MSKKWEDKSEKMKDKGKGGNYKVGPFLLFVQPLFILVIRSKQFCPEKKKKRKKNCFVYLFEQYRAFLFGDLC